MNHFLITNLFLFICPGWCMDRAMPAEVVTVVVAVTTAPSDRAAPTVEMPIAAIAVIANGNRTNFAMDIRQPSENNRQ
jgi:hypothetical protein